MLAVVDRDPAFYVMCIARLAENHLLCFGRSLFSAEDY